MADAEVGAKFGLGEAEGGAQGAYFFGFDAADDGACGHAAALVVE